MSFYDDWLDAIKNSDDDIDYLEAFLKKKDYTLRILHSGNNEQVEVFCRILLNYDFKKIIDLIDDNYISELNCSKVIQFSNLENGTYNLVRVLYGHNEGVSQTKRY